MNRFEFILEMLDILVEGEHTEEFRIKCAERIDYVVSVEIEGLIQVERLDD